MNALPDPIDNKELREEILAAVFDVDPGDVEPFPAEDMGGLEGVYGMQTIDEMTVDRIQTLLHQVDRAAEDRMGEAIIARHRQANGQWEKTESFIRSYQSVQKVEDPHGILASLQTGGEVRCTVCGNLGHTFIDCPESEASPV